MLSRIFGPHSVVLVLAHGIPIGGHLGITKLMYQTLKHYYWPCGLPVSHKVEQNLPDLAVRQRNETSLRINGIKAFYLDYIHLNCNGFVGAIADDQKRKSVFHLLSLIMLLRYPEVNHLPSSEVHHIAREYILLFSQIGVLDEVLSDQWENFLSKLMEEVYFILPIEDPNNIQHPTNPKLTNWSGISIVY